MTEKEATSQMYSDLWPANLVERDGVYNIFKGEQEEYINCKLDGDNSDVSPIFNTIEEARQWSQQ